MPRKLQETVIDGHTYRLRQFGADTGSDILFRLGRGLAMSDLKPADFQYVRDLFKGACELQIVDTKGNGAKNWAPLESSFDDHFAGRYQQMGEWLRWAFETNYGPIFAALKDLIGAKAAGLSSIVQKDADGLSGDSSLPSTSE
jgi:hypothetical protein